MTLLSYGRLFLAVPVLLILCSCSQKIDYDAIIGSWSGEVAESKSGPFSWCTAYAADGSMRTYWASDNPDRMLGSKRIAILEGNWELGRGKRLITIVGDNDPQTRIDMNELRVTTVHVITHISGDTMNYTELGKSKEENTEFSVKRIKSCGPEQLKNVAG